MKKEINYLSLPDYFNKFILTNYNQKIDFKDNIMLQFRLSNKYHLGSAIKAIYLLETIFPKKAFVLKIKIKKKKLYFGQKSKLTNSFNFNMTLSSLEFIDLFRFFIKTPISFKKSNDLLIVNRKLKQFEFSKNIFMIPINNKFSFFVFTNFYLN